MDPLKLKPVSNTRHSITMTWMAFKENNVTYKLQRRDKLKGWTTVYWGFHTQIEVKNLGPEECYHFRVGVLRDGEDNPSLWSRTVPANTKDDVVLVGNLHRSVQYGNVNAVRKFIISRPAALDCYNQLGQPTLSMSANPQITAILLNAGATIDLPSKFSGRTALMEAAAQGHVEVAALLVERGASWQTRDRVGCTALHHAVDASQEAIVELAITTGANLDIVDSCGWTPLTRGVVVGSDLAVLELLVGAKADVSVKDGAGHSSLLLAVLSRQPHVTRLLLSAGATVPDPQALVSVAAAHQDLEIESLLKEHFALEEKSPCETRISSAIQLSANSNSP